MARRRPAGPSADSHDRMRESVALLEMLALGDRQIEAGQVQPAGQVVVQLRGVIRRTVRRPAEGRIGAPGPDET